MRKSESVANTTDEIESIRFSGKAYLVGWPSLLEMGVFVACHYL